MVQRPGSLPEFEAQFPDDEACARWLFERRWPDGFRCPGCGHAKGWELGRGTLLVECARCRRQTSVTAGTVPPPALVARRQGAAPQPPAAQALVPGGVAGGDPQERHLGPAAVAPARARLPQNPPGAAPPTPP